MLTEVADPETRRFGIEQCAVDIELHCAGWRVACHRRAEKLTDWPHSEGFKLDETAVLELLELTSGHRSRARVVVAVVAVVVRRHRVGPSWQARRGTGRCSRIARRYARRAATSIGTPGHRSRHNFRLSAIRLPALHCAVVAVMVAVNVTDWLKFEGFRLEPTLTVVPAEFTVWPPANVPVLPELMVSPEYVAVTVCVPAVSVAVLIEVAEPDTRLSVSNNALST